MRILRVLKNITNTQGFYKFIISPEANIMKNVPGWEIDKDAIDILKNSTTTFNITDFNTFLGTRHSIIE